jgi:MFS superfamily sulfate permease-like transporter
MRDFFGYTVGYLAAFLLMSALGTVLAFAFFCLVIAAIVFITWQMPILLPSFWIILRICVVLGSFLGMAFTTSHEGREYAKEIKEMFVG